MFLRRAAHFPLVVSLVFQTPPSGSGGVTPLDVSIMVPTFLLWVGVVAVTLYALVKGKLARKVQLALLALAVILGGVVVGGVPNAVMPLTALVAQLDPTGAGPLVVPVVVVLVVLLLLTLSAGRVFCGYACPVGALQELVSAATFKRTVIAQKRVSWRASVSTRVSRAVRAAFLAGVVLLMGVWGVAVLQLLDPFQGFRVFQAPALPAILIPALVLATIAVASAFVYRPWCRFLCPFGLVADAAACASPVKLRRTAACVECGVCERICPTGQAGADSKKGECYLCMRCVAACPHDAIRFGRARRDAVGDDTAGDDPVVDDPVEKDPTGEDATALPDEVAGQAGP